MASMFYASEFERPFPIPYLFSELVAELIESNDARSEKDVMACIRRALVECKIVGKPKDDDVKYAVERLVEARAESEAPAEEGEEGEDTEDMDGKAFGGGFGKWIKELNPDQMCLYVADYDYETARSLYCMVDQKDVKEMANTKVGGEWEKAKIRFESVLFGFGGGYKKSLPELGEGDNKVNLVTGEGVKGLNEALRL